jgi:hypothetical protein
LDGYILLVLLRCGPDPLSLLAERRGVVWAAGPMMFGDDCDRCGGRVRQRGDHTCPSCAEFIGRDPRRPFWGDFAGHPDAALRPRTAGGED